MASETALAARLRAAFYTDLEANTDLTDDELDVLSLSLVETAARLRGLTAPPEPTGCVVCGHKRHLKGRCDVAIGVDDRGGDGMCPCAFSSTYAPAPRPQEAALREEIVGRMADMVAGKLREAFRAGFNAHPADTQQWKDTGCDESKYQWAFDGQIAGDLEPLAWKQWLSQDKVVLLSLAAAPRQDERPAPPFTLEPFTKDQVIHEAQLARTQRAAEMLHNYANYCAATLVEDK